MSKVIATVNINLGLPDQNPSITIHQNDSIPALIEKFIEDYHLPSKVYSIIHDKVIENLQHNTIHNNTYSNTNAKNNNNKLQKKSTVAKSPLRTEASKVLREEAKSIKKEIHRNPPRQNNQKQNNKNSVNTVQSQRTPKSPLNRTKIQLKPFSNKSKTPQKKPPSKTPTKARQSKSPLQREEEHIVRLFKLLTAENPSQINILSPEYINLRGVSKELLSELHLFFMELEQHQFQLMDQPYFVRRVKEKNFKGRLVRKMKP